MQTQTKSELQMLREFGWFLLSQMYCFFCKKPLLVKPTNMTFGHRHHPPIKTRLSLHHIHFDRTKNSPEDLGPSHRNCHIKYHAELRMQSQVEGKTGDDVF